MSTLKFESIINPVSIAQQDQKKKTPRVFYHVTMTANLERIMSQGLIPAIGDRSIKVETQKAIHLFKRRGEADDAVMNWLGDEFDEEDPLALIRVILPDGIKATKDSMGAYMVSEPIPPECLKVVSKDF